MIEVAPNDYVFTEADMITAKCAMLCSDLGDPQACPHNDLLSAMTAFAPNDYAFTEVDMLTAMQTPAVACESFHMFTEADMFAAKCAMLGVDPADAQDSQALFTSDDEMWAYFEQHGLPNHVISSKDTAYIRYGLTSAGCDIDLDAPPAENAHIAAGQVATGHALQIVRDKGTHTEHVAHLLDESSMKTCSGMCYPMILESGSGVDNATSVEIDWTFLDHVQAADKYDLDAPLTTKIIKITDLVCKPLLVGFKCEFMPLGADVTPLRGRRIPSNELAEVNLKIEVLTAKVTKQEQTIHVLEVALDQRGPKMTISSKITDQSEKTLAHCHKEVV